MEKSLRLDRFLSDAGKGTRSEVKGLIKKSIVTVNGTVIKDGSFKIKTETDEVLINGEKVEYSAFLYYMLNKPAGVVSATRDGLSDTVIELLNGEPVKNLFPVGRLDKDTEGLLLITNDGMLAHELLSPKKHVDKIYHAVSNKTLGDKELSAFSKGIDIGDDKPCLPAGIKQIDIGEYEEKCPEKMPCYEVTLREGRYHQVKRMFEACGAEVVYLKRISMGALTLDNSLKPGWFRKLTEKEIKQLKNR